MDEFRRNAASVGLSARPADETDAAGGITLSGRNRACARARVLAGMALTSGLVISLTSVDTSVSARS